MFPPRRRNRTPAAESNPGRKESPKKELAGNRVILEEKKVRRKEKARREKRKREMEKIEMIK